MVLEWVPERNVSIIVENCKILKILRESAISEVKESSAESVLENL